MWDSFDDDYCRAVGSGDYYPGYNSNQFLQQMILSGMVNVYVDNEGSDSDKDASDDEPDDNELRQIEVREPL